MVEQSKRKPYQTDLTDAEWQKVEHCIPKPKTKRGRYPEPSAAVPDSQSVKTTETPGVRGYDAGKKVNGQSNSATGYWK